MIVMNSQVQAPAATGPLVSSRRTRQLARLIDDIAPLDWVPVVETTSRPSGAFERTPRTKWCLSSRFAIGEIHVDAVAL